MRALRHPKLTAHLDKLPPKLVDIDAHHGASCKTQVVLLVYTYSLASSQLVSLRLLLSSRLLCRRLSTWQVRAEGQNLHNGFILHVAGARGGGGLDGHAHARRAHADRGVEIRRGRRPHRCAPSLR